MKYDDASWHYDSDFPTDLPAEAGATHIGMFLAWCIVNSLGGTFFEEEIPNAIAELRERRITPGKYLIEYCDEKFTDEMLNDEGNAFAEAYFQDRYIFDYADLLAGAVPSCYHVADTWATFDIVSRLLAKRFDEWKNGALETVPVPEVSLEEPEKPWWKFW